MSWVKKHVVEFMNFCALVGLLATIFYAHTQLQEARRVAAVTSLLALKSDVVESRRRVRDFVAARALEPQENPSQARLSAFRLDLLDYLLTIEYSCTLYLNGLLGREAARFLEDEIGTDLEFLGDPDPMFSFYENGQLVLSEDDSVDWVDPNNPGSNPRYPNTLKCADCLGVKIGGTAPGLH